MKRHIYTEEGQSISATLRELNVLKPPCESYYTKKGKPFLYINFSCVFVCLFVSNKRQNDRTDRAHNFCGTLRDPRKGV